MDVKEFWKAVLSQNREALPSFFEAGARICWHNTNECFTVPEFVRANCDYPGQWDGEVERIEIQGDLMITVTCVHDRDRTTFFHAVSFFRIRNGKILSLDEYWGDDGQPPRWRQEMHIGSPISGRK